jgi:hypothetical protein
MKYLIRSAALIAFTAIYSAVPAYAYNGDAIYYYTGLGNCGWQSKDTDYIVALSIPEYNNGAHCGQHVTVFYQGKSVDATVVDSCPGCSQYSIELSPAAFQALAPLSAERIQVQWNYA